MDEAKRVEILKRIEEIYEELKKLEVKLCDLALEVAEK